jgi:aspartyl-tRNA(Asn)/glutamyl-tRNA(Gln) amidotransferase subunit A
MLTDLTVAALRDGVAKGEFTAVEVAEAFNAAVAGAGRSTPISPPRPSCAGCGAQGGCRARGGQALGPLAGVPIG